jgi:hypothetical protein
LLCVKKIVYLKRLVVVQSANRRTSHFSFPARLYPVFTCTPARAPRGAGTQRVSNYRCVNRVPKVHDEKNK